MGYMIYLHDETYQLGIGWFLKNTRIINGTQQFWWFDDFALHRKWEKLHEEGRDEEVSWKFWQKQYSFREQYGVGLDPDELEGLWLRLQILVSGRTDSGSYVDFFGNKNLSNLGSELVLNLWVISILLKVKSVQQVQFFVWGYQSLAYISSLINATYREWWIQSAPSSRHTSGVTVERSPELVSHHTSESQSVDYPSRKSWVEKRKSSLTNKSHKKNVSMDLSTIVCCCRFGEKTFGDRQIQAIGIC